MLTAGIAKAQYYQQPYQYMPYQYQYGPGVSINVGVPGYAPGFYNGYNLYNYGYVYRPRYLYRGGCGRYNGWRRGRR